MSEQKTNIMLTDLLNVVYKTDKKRMVFLGKEQMLDFQISQMKDTIVNVTVSYEGRIRTLSFENQTVRLMSTEDMCALVPAMDGSRHFILVYELYLSNNQNLIDLIKGN